MICPKSERSNEPKSELDLFEQSSVRISDVRFSAFHCIFNRFLKIMSQLCSDYRTTKYETNASLRVRYSNRASMCVN